MITAAHIVMNPHLLMALLLCLLHVGCGAGSSDGDSDSGSDTTTTETFSIGGTTSGLSGTVVLQNNAADDLSLTANGAFTFATSVASGATYAVTVLTQPIGQTCSVSSGSGTVTAAVTSVSVVCSATTHAVGGIISGLSGTVVLQNNAGDNLSLTANGALTFATAVAYGSAYAVTVLTQPTGQTCSVSGGSGTIAGDVTSVSVVCSTNSYTVGGTLSGLSGTLVLQNNGGDNLTLTSSGSLTFATSVAHGAAYAVTVSSEPALQNCTVSNGSGTISGANISTVSVSCADRAWAHQSYLKPPQTNNGDDFGTAVAISADTIVVGELFEDSNSTSIINGSDLSGANDSGSANGAAHVFTRSGSTWSYQAYLKPPSTTNNDIFGVSVAIDADTIVVGANAEDSSTTAIINGTDLSSTNDSGSAAGAAYVFTRSGTSWSHQAYLKAPNASTSDEFGISVAVDGSTVVVGANAEDGNSTAIINGSDLSAANNSGSNNGAAYVFTRSGTTWSHEAYLKAPSTTNEDGLGQAVALDGDTTVAGSRGEDSTTTSIINGTDLSSTNESGGANGAAYVFTRSGTTWSHQAYLKAPNTSNSDFFSTSLAVDSDTIVVGAMQEASTTTSIINGTDLSSTNNSGTVNGAVYVFTRSGTSWSHEAYLKAPNTSNSDQFGISVAASGNIIAVGASTEDSSTTSIISGADLSSANDTGSNNGAVYVFTRSGTTWSHHAYLKAPNSSNDDLFGTAVDVDDDTIVVGAKREDSTTTSIINGSSLSSANDSGDNNGAVYVFTLE